MTIRKFKDVLIVEDEALIAMHLKMKFVNWGFNVVGIAANYHGVCRVVERETPELVMMDINLSGEYDGIEIAECLQRKFSLKIIFMTGYQNQAYRERALKVDPAAYLLKPICFDSLSEILRSL